WRWSHQLILLLVIASLLSCLATLGAFSGWLSFSDSPRVVSRLLLLDLGLLLALIFTIVRNLLQLRRDIAKKTRKTSIKQRFVLLFAGIALVPSVVMLVFAAYFLNFGLQAWFSERIRTTMKESLSVAEFYLTEQQQQARNDAILIGRGLLQQASAANQSLANPDPIILSQLLTEQSAALGIGDAMLTDTGGRVVARTKQSFAWDIEPIDDIRARALQSGEVVIAVNQGRSRLRALVYLPSPLNATLQISRLIAPEMAEHVAKTRAAFQQYEQLEGRRASIQLTFVLIFVVVALLLLMITVWFGIVLADRFAQPLQLLASRVSTLRLGEQLPDLNENSSIYEIDSLTRSFRRMLRQILDDQQALQQVNLLLDERRQFIETTLTSVSAGVLRVNPDGVVEYANPAAEKDLADTQLVGKSLASILPSLQELLDEAVAKDQAVFEKQISVELPPQGSSGPSWRHYFVRIGQEVVAEHSGSHATVRGYVLTLDDITDYLAVQKRAAWSEVARRLAHEIKNPLTPIQLATERLQKKYLPTEPSTQDDFRICTDTILRQTSDIRRMVDEFSMFARLPSPDRKREDLVDLVRGVHRMMQLGHENIRFDLTLPQQPMWLQMDAQQMRQALSNLYLNAVEAVAEQSVARIDVALSLDSAAISPQALLTITDNGGGFSPDMLSRALEPYVTTKPKGTGLGLAIVAKIVEDHFGKLELTNLPSPTSGAQIRILLPIES
ncbi:MAG: HAMP domain-containing protein, partial [Alphaproteobacteria bacterium]|nr:HAMP domain-containing protein [Alphaproteobacteria bacterium]